MPGLQMLFTAIDNKNLPDKQHLGGILQMCFIRASQILDKLSPAFSPSDQSWFPPAPALLPAAHSTDVSRDVSQTLIP
jgi:hypothetical protein